MSEPNEFVVSASRLAKTYGSVQALRDISFTVRAGEVVGILGPNGAGKSTALGIVLGLLEATSGTVKLFGRLPHDPSARSRIGYMPETPIFADHHTVRSLLTYHCGLLRMRTKEMKRETEETLALAGISDVIDRRLRTLSKGMLQRAALAVALLGTPDLLLLDEPTSNFDPVGRRELCQLIIARRSSGVAIIFASHVLSEVEAACDRVVILKQGMVALQGPLRGLCENSGAPRSLEEVFFDAVGESSGATV